MKSYFDNIAISNIEWDCSYTQYNDNELPDEIKISDIPKDVISECIEDKNTDALIEYLSDEYDFCVVSYEPSDDLNAIINEGCNLYEINTRIEGYGAYSSCDPGVLHNIDGEKGRVQGTYSFGVAAKNEKEAIAKADEVFNEHWDNGDVDCGEIRKSEQICYSDGDKSKYRVSDCIVYNKENKERALEK